ncbi:SGNH/GDSL hydrolase family protein [Rhodopseudomonas sp. AAP120]|uniref:SGNH/GDSL hydrolase family protein n=1 Tax=Rhodopseudomonas sp. AAP120 TaxID=1523430 RepID=UPI0006B96FCB|nr:SGNH/GDSL hydrolase family protein [Rhodopseudomonas sp. AAP120]
MGRQQSRAIDARSSRPYRRRKKQAVLGCMIAAAGLVGAASSAAAQVYTPIAVVPNPDVYAYFQQNAGVQSLFGPQVTGQFTSLTVFGDSYADWGNAKRAQGGVGTSTGRFSAGLSMGDAFQYHYGLATSSVANYAVGGAQSGETNVAGPTLPGTGSEIRTFLANGGRFGARDLVNITTAGGNDGVPILFNPFITQAQMNAAAAQTNANIVGGVQQLV